MENGDGNEIEVRVPIKNGSRLTLIVFAINFLLFVANLYLSNGYVSRAVYDADTKDALQRREALTKTLADIAGDLRVIKEHMQGDDEQNRKLDKLDERVRGLETGRASR
jgi:hypothetical protein